MQWIEVYVSGGVLVGAAAVMARLDVATLAPRMLPFCAVDVGPKLSLPDLPCFSPRSFAGPRFRRGFVVEGNSGKVHGSVSTLAIKDAGDVERMHQREEFRQKTWFFL